MRCSLTVLLLLAGVSSHAQIRIKLFYTKDWLLTSYDSSVYYRECTLDTVYQRFDGQLIDFAKSGKVLMTGSYHDRMRSGKFVSYYPSGKLESEGSYNEGRRTGKWKYFYEGGGLKYEVRYGKGKEDMVTANDSLGHAFIEDGTGTWIERYVEPGTKTIMTIKGMLKNGDRVGTWTHTDSDGKVWSEETYDRGEFVKGFVLADNERIELVQHFTKLVPDSKHDRVESFAYTKGATSEEYPFLKKREWKEDKYSEEEFGRLEVSGRPNNGMDAFYQEVMSGLTGNYPTEARRNGIQGRVFVEFVVEKDGSLSSFKVVKGIGGGCDEVAVKAIIESQRKVKWIPGVQSRKKVKQRYTLPLIFKLG